jgi:hypothetical protein
MNAGERFHRFLERRKLRKMLQRKGINPNGSFYVVSDYGYEDVSYDGPFSLNEALKEYKIQSGHDDIWNAFDNTTVHYITNDTWHIARLDERRNDGW